MHDPWSMRYDNRWLFKENHWTNSLSLLNLVLTQPRNEYLRCSSNCRFFASNGNKNSDRTVCLALSEKRQEENKLDPPRALLTQMILSANNRSRKYLLLNLKQLVFSEEFVEVVFEHICLSARQRKLKRWELTEDLLLFPVFSRQVRHWTYSSTFRSCSVPRNANITTRKRLQPRKYSSSLITYFTFFCRILSSGFGCYNYFLRQHFHPSSHLMEICRNF